MLLVLWRNSCHIRRDRTLLNSDACVTGKGMNLVNGTVRQKMIAIMQLVLYYGSKGIYLVDREGQMKIIL